MNKLISIIIPVYKVEEYLEKCVDSVIKQTYDNLEIILVDDGSPDNCGKICDQYSKKDKRVKVIHKENGGLSDARNAGIDISRGEYISFIDSDDYVEIDYIETLYNSIIKSKADLAVCAHKVVYSNGSVIDKATNNYYEYTSKEALKHMLYDQDLDLSAWGKLYKRNLFDNVRYPKGRIFEDAATTYKLIDNAKKVVVYSMSKYFYIIRKKSITTNNFTMKKMDLIKSTDEMCTFIKNKYPDLEQAADRRMMYAYMSTLTQFVKSNCKNSEVEDKLMTYIKNNSKKILKDKQIPKRDRIALISIKFGIKFYKIIWNFYEKITGRN